MRSRPISSTAVVLAALALLVGCDEINARRAIQDGNKLHAQDEHEKAIAKYEEALKLAPSVAIGWYNLAIAHADLYKAGDKEAANEAHATGAIDALNKYLAFSPKDEMARKLLLGLYTKSGRWDGALDYFKGEYDKAPKDPYNVAQLADLNKQAGRWDDARKWYGVLAEVEPKVEGQAIAWQAMGVSYYTQLKDLNIVGDERVKLADSGLAALGKSAELNPKDSVTYTFMNLLYRQRSAGQKSYVVVVDTVSADQLRKKSVEIKNANAPAAPAAPTPAPGTPESPPAKP